MATTIIVADDQSLVRMGLVRMLSDVPDFSVVAEAETGEDAVTLVRQHLPDVVLMDVRMPGIGGLEATKKILSIHPKAKVVAVTGVSDVTYADRLFKVGGAGYVTKDAGFEEIIQAVDKVVSGERYMSASVAQNLALKNVNTEPEISPFDKLSERELQTAVMISSGMKAADIAESFCISSKTVNSYRYRIFEKLKINTDVELALLAAKYNLLDV